MIRESRVEKRLVDAVRAVGGFAYKWTSPGRRGVPDRLVLLPDGELVFVEVKSPGGTLSPVQRVEIDRIRSLGFRVEVVSDEDGIERVMGVRS